MSSGRRLIAHGSSQPPTRALMKRGGANMVVPTYPLAPQKTTMAMRTGRLGRFVAIQDG